jgi:hypothetical protein
MLDLPVPYRRSGSQSPEEGPFSGNEKSWMAPCLIFRARANHVRALYDTVRLDDRSANGDQQGQHEGHLRIRGSLPENGRAVSRRAGGSFAVYRMGGFSAAATSRIVLSRCFGRFGYPQGPKARSSVYAYGEAWLG